MLLRVYEHVPPWLVALSLAAAAGSFIAVFRWQQRRGLIEYMPALALGVAAVLLALAGCYVWFSVAPDVNLVARLAVLRVMLILLSGGLIHYNAGALRLSWREWQERRSHHD